MFCGLTDGEVAEESHEILSIVVGVICGNMAVKL